MIPTAFDEENCVLDPPPGMTVNECQVLSVFRGVMGDNCPVVVSCWKPTKEEMEEISRTGRVWLVIMGGSMPPSYVSGSKPFLDAARASDGE